MLYMSTIYSTTPSPSSIDKYCYNQFMSEIRNESSLVRILKTVKIRLFRQQLAGSLTEQNYNGPKIETDPVKLEDFIGQGLNLIKHRQYKAASNYFRNEEMARSLGVAYDPTPLTFVLQDLSPEEQLTKLINDIANYSHEEPITIGNFSPHALPARLLNSPGFQSIMSRIDPNIALIGAEEWTHTLQNTVKKPLAGYENEEIDVAAYFHKKDVPLTPEFSGRYQRGRYLSNPGNTTQNANGM